jgi:hypothetical protein
LSVEFGLRPRTCLRGYSLPRLNESNKDRTGRKKGHLEINKVKRAPNRSF